RARRHARLGIGLSGLALTVLVVPPALAFSSVLNAVAARIPNRQRTIRLRSRCPRCGSVASLMESIALFSYLWRRGRCFHCGTRRSLRYPFFELLTAFLCVASFTHFGITGRAFVGAL